jgi:L-threonylcarbamoyladenylate synthase
MEIITSKQLEEAIAVLKQGGVVVFPTETAYGLAADATNSDAVQRIYEIKERMSEKSLPIIAVDREMVERFVGIPSGFHRLAHRYWPGPLTLILPVLSDQLASGVVTNGEVAVRVSSHPIAQALSKGLGQPIVSTSANKSGDPVCYSVHAVKEQLDSLPDYYLDAGELIPEPPSTIVTLDDYGLPEVLRQGSVKIDAL